MKKKASSRELAFGKLFARLTERKEESGMRAKRLCEDGRRDAAGAIPPRHEITAPQLAVTGAT
jgi:hypothetical protein